MSGKSRNQQHALEEAEKDSSKNGVEQKVFSGEYYFVDVEDGEQDERRTENMELAFICVR